MKEFVKQIEDLMFLRKEVTTVTMCGKIKYEENMREWAALLEKGAGWNMLLPIDIYKLTGYNPRFEKSSMDKLRAIHYTKIKLSDAILVYVDEDYEFLDSENVMSEILAALSFDKEIYFTTGIRHDIIHKLSEFVNESVGVDGKRFHVNLYKYIDIDKFRFYRLYYSVDYDKV